jgi:uncharacterized glyoxalase superfamily protein PhnB
VRRQPTSTTPAKAAGAEIVMEPTDQEYGDRRYDAKDPEGHFWSFATPLAELPTDVVNAADRR